MTQFHYQPGNPELQFSITTCVREDRGTFHTSKATGAFYSGNASVSELSAPFIKKNQNKIKGAWLFSWLGLQLTLGVTGHEVGRTSDWNKAHTLSHSLTPRGSSGSNSNHSFWRLEETREPYRTFLGFFFTTHAASYLLRSRATESKTERRFVCLFKDPLVESIF